MIVPLKFLATDDIGLQFNEVYVIQIANKSTELISQLRCIAPVVTEISSLGQAVQSAPNNLILQYVCAEDLETTKRLRVLKGKQFQTLVEINSSSKAMEQFSSRC